MVPWVGFKDIRSIYTSVYYCCKSFLCCTAVSQCHGGSVDRFAGFTAVLFTGVYNNQDLLWCIKIGVYMGFCIHRGF